MMGRGGDPSGNDIFYVDLATASVRQIVKDFIKNSRQGALALNQMPHDTICVENEPCYSRSHQRLCLLVSAFKDQAAPHDL